MAAHCEVGSRVTKPLITVIVPAKDAAAYIATTLHTLTRQFDDSSAVKLVAINDGSIDETGEIIREYAEKFDHVTVLENARPVGLASARNQGLEHVEGDTFCFLDADDWMQPLRLQTLASRLADLQCDFVRTDHVTVKDHVRTLIRAPHPWRERVQSPRDAILPKNEKTMVDYPYAWAGIFHRRILDDGLAAFPAGLHTAEDRPWIWNLHLRARSFAVVDAPALLYRRGVGTSLTQIRDRRQLDFATAMAQVIEAVAADSDAERFMPKAVWTALALSSHHLVRSRRMPLNLRREMRARIGSLIEQLPPEHLRAAVHGFDGPRRRVLADLVRKSGSAR